MKNYKKLTGNLLKELQKLSKNEQIIISELRAQINYNSKTLREV